MSQPVIQVEHLSKRYVIGHEIAKEDGLRHVIEGVLRAPLAFLQGARRRTEEEFWALQDVNFDVEEGEVLGIIGRNGAGKSTLLKILSRITEPTSGRVRIRGRVASLLEVGTGFHPELTGRENIFLNGAILGMSRLEIRRKFDEIVAFAGIEKFIDTPVKRYSSGMYVRLAFSVAAHLDSNILVVDEVLAVGDMEFQRKCLARMDSIAHDQGRTILFVSHNMAAVQNLCSSCIVLQQGSVLLRATPERALNYYAENIMPSDVSTQGLRQRKDRSGSGLIRLTDFRFEDARGEPLVCVPSGADVVVVLDYEVSTPTLMLSKVDVGISVATNTDQLLFVIYSSYAGCYLNPASPRGSFRCRIARLPLSPGRYILGARVVVNHEEADWPQNGLGFLEVEGGDFYGTGSAGFAGATPFLVRGDWSITGAAEEKNVLTPSR